MRSHFENSTPGINKVATTSFPLNLFNSKKYGSKNKGNSHSFPSVRQIPDLKLHNSSGVTYMTHDRRMSVFDLLVIRLTLAGNN